MLYQSRYTATIQEKKRLSCLSPDLEIAEKSLLTQILQSAISMPTPDLFVTNESTRLGIVRAGLALSNCIFRD